MGTTDDGRTDHPAYPTASESPLTVVAANILMTCAVPAGQKESPSGTKHFKPGAVVYVIDWEPSSVCHLVVIGHHRKSRQFVKAAVAVELVEQFCIKEITTPNVIALAGKHATANGKVLTREHAETMLRELRLRHHEGV